MNTENLHQIIGRYAEQYEIINNDDHFELFKWRAAKHYYDVLHSPTAKGLPFSQLFKEAKKEFSVLTDNGFVSPASGVVKIAEKKEAEAEALFRDVLWADDGGDLSLRQDHMEEFLVEMDKLRMETFPSSHKYKQDRHAVSCYLALLNPEKNYIYRYSNAKEFADYIEFGKEMGSGENFRLDNYYELCDILVEALKEHPTLLEKYYARLDADESLYRDNSLHLMAFDVMYCARTYNFYDGLTFIPRKKPTAKTTKAALEEQKLLEQAAKICALEEKLRTLEIQAEPYEQISLLNVFVHDKKRGEGRVIKQEIRQNDIWIRVAFAGSEASFNIHRKFFMRPTFEDDEQVITAFTEYSDLLKEIALCKVELDFLKAK